MPATDVHRHLCTPRLFETLACRTSEPRVRRDGHAWRLEVANEAPAPMPPLPEPAAGARSELAASGLDRGIVALSAALGIEHLPGHESRTILDAWHADAAELPDGLEAWGSLPLSDAGPQDVDTALAAGRRGITVPAGALATPADLHALGPVLERLEQRGGILFVHPGPAAPGAWQPALTAYPATLMTAWLAWAAHGRPAHPRLRVLFAALAGLAPLHAERIGARGGPGLATAALADELVFYDTSSYGPIATRAMTSVVGLGQLVYGSDRPWAGRPGEHRFLPERFSGANTELLFKATA